MRIRCQLFGAPVAAQAVAGYRDERVATSSTGPIPSWRRHRWQLRIPNRREFLQTDCRRTGRGRAQRDGRGRSNPKRTNSGGIPLRPLGRTGEMVSLLCLGGYSSTDLNKMSEAESLRLIQRAVARGNHLPGQRLGLPRRRRRGADGQGPGRGEAPRQGLPHDQGLRPHRQGRPVQPRGQPPPPQDRPDRPLAVPRDGATTTTPTGSSPRTAPSTPASRRSRTARSATSASPATRTRRSTSRCSASPTTGRPSRCR